MAHSLVDFPLVTLTVSEVLKVGSRKHLYHPGVNARNLLWKLLIIAIIRAGKIVLEYQSNPPEILSITTMACWEGYSPRKRFVLNKVI